MMKLVSAVAGIGLVMALGVSSPASAADTPPISKRVVKKSKKMAIHRHRHRHIRHRRIIRIRTVVRYVYVPHRRHARYRYARPYYIGYGYRYAPRYPYWRHRYAFYRPHYHRPYGWWW